MLFEGLHREGKIAAVLDVYHERLREEAEDRPPTSNEERDRRLVAVGPDAGQLINILARSLKAPIILEIGTSYGYSAIWLAEAARATGGRVITMELRDYKAAYARQIAAKAGLADHIDFMVGDALQMIPQLQIGLDLVLLDIWKELYLASLEAFYPKLKAGAIIVADNMVFPGREEARRYGEAIRAKPGITSVLLPVGMGLDVSRYQPD